LRFDVAKAGFDGNAAPAQFFDAAQEAVIATA
jgi:hypothetical protein